MNTDDEFAKILREVAPLPDLERAEALLRFFASAIREMDTRSLRQFRAYCWARSEDTEAETAMLDIIDGQLALRELTGDRA